MKKLIIILIGICLLSIDCIGQNNKGNDTNKRLDAKIIETFKKNGKYEKTINDTLFILTETKLYYIFRTKPIGKNFQQIVCYDKKHFLCEEKIKNLMV